MSPLEIRVTATSLLSLAAIHAQTTAPVVNTIGNELTAFLTKLYQNKRDKGGCSDNHEQPVFIDIDLSIAGDTLVIRGEKKEGKEEKGRSYYYSERTYGPFSRAIPLPLQVNVDKVSANFKKGY